MVCPVVCQFSVLHTHFRFIHRHQQYWKCRSNNYVLYELNGGLFDLLYQFKFDLGLSLLFSGLDIPLPYILSDLTLDRHAQDRITKISDLLT